MHIVYWILDSLMMFVVGGCIFMLIVIAAWMAWAALRGIDKSKPGVSDTLAFPSYEKFKNRTALLSSTRNDGALAMYVADDGVIHTYVYQGCAWLPCGWQ